MGYEIYIVGKNIDVSRYTSETYVKKDDKCIVSFLSREEAANEIQNINSKKNNVAGFFDDIKYCLEKPLLKYNEIENMSFEDLIKNQFCGTEQFIVLNDGVLSVHSVNNRNIEQLSKSKMYGSFCMSNTGIFLINYFASTLKCYVEDFTKLFSELYFDSKIDKIEFSNQDTFLAVSTQSKIYIIDSYKSTIILCENLEKTAFDSHEKLIYFFDTKRVYNLITEQYCEYPVDLHYFISKNEQTFMYLKGKNQRIIYETKNHSIKKTQAYIHSIDFGFSKDIGYLYITKKIKDTYLYSIEVYIDDMIIAINFENKLLDYKISRKFLIAFDENKNLIFYKKIDKIYKKIKEHKKDANVLLSLSNNIACIFDEANETLEFYDNGLLRNVYMLRDCTELHWSYSGLYLIVFSKQYGGIQLYNNNGELLLKKIHNMFTTFLWRPFICLTEEKKKKLEEYEIDKYVEDLRRDAGEEYKVETLLGNWKSFLIEKKRLLNK